MGRSRRISQIVIAARQVPVAPSLVKEIRAITGKPVAEVANALSSGGALFEGELFSRPRQERFAQVRNLVQVLCQAGIEPSVSENGRLISSRTLLNIIAASEESAAHLRELDDEGHS